MLGLLCQLYSIWGLSLHQGHPQLYEHSKEAGIQDKDLALTLVMVFNMFFV